MELTKSFLSGSQPKTAFALRLNAERLVREDGLNCTGFLTLTVGDYYCNIHGKQIPRARNYCPCCGHGKKMLFIKVQDPKEAARRFDNLNRRVIRDLFKRAIAVSERHRDKGMHFHLLGSLACKADIRTGFNFDAVAKRDYRSAPTEIRAIWQMLRKTLPEYGFGRAELLPIKKTGEAVAAYVSKYIEKHVCNRLIEDRRKKLVRYIGWKTTHLKANEFEWDGEKARAWRGKSRQMLGLLEIDLPDTNEAPRRHVADACAAAAGKIRPKWLDGTQAREILGSRWAFHLHNFIQKLSDEPVPEMVWDYLQRELVKRELAALAGARHVRHIEREKVYLVCGEGYTAREIREIDAEFGNN